MPKKSSKLVDATCGRCRKKIRVHRHYMTISILCAMCAVRVCPACEQIDLHAPGCHLGCGLKRDKK